LAAECGVAVADPDCFAAGASVYLVDEPVDAREAFTGLAEIHDEQGLRRICRKRISAPEEPHHMEAGNASIGCEQRRSGQSCPGPRSAEPSVKIGAVGTVGDWVAGEAFMVIPDVGFSPACSARATAQ
jgi:hypothetical protein